MDRGGTGTCSGFPGVFLSVSAEETGFLLQPACEKEYSVLEQICARSASGNSPAGVCYGYMRDFSGCGGRRVCAFCMELYGEELPGCSGSVPDLLPYRYALYHSLRECVFSAGHVRRIYSLFPHTDGECVCHICFRLVSDLLQDTAFRENEDTVIPVFTGRGSDRQRCV